MKWFLITLIKAYRYTLSPFIQRLGMGKGSICRYSPTCSEYAITSIERFGVLQGSFISIRRFISCNSFSKKAYLDPVPQNLA